MAQKLFHIFRNTPLGRETLLQSIYFCQKIGVLPTIYIPEFTKFLMYFENDVVQVDISLVRSIYVKIGKRGQKNEKQYQTDNITPETLAGNRIYCSSHITSPCR